MKQKKNKIIYYTDELNDDFAGNNIKKKKVDEKFKYVRKNIVWKFFSGLIYWCIAYPIVWFYVRVILQVKFVNKKAIKKLNRSCFIYGNHTGIIDAFIPNLISSHRRNRIVVGPDAVSINGIKNLVQMLGAVPIADNYKGMRKFVNAIEYFNKKDNITIYPEAHIWPYFTGVRPFTDTSFRYPVKLNAPVIVFFTAYSRPKGFLSIFRKANITVYVSEPIYPNLDLSPKEAQKDLRDKAYNFMIQMSKYSDYEVITYKHINENQ